jgi:hypothetical protein
MRKIAIAAGAAVLLAGGAYYGLLMLPDNQFRAGLDQALAGLPQGYTARYGSALYSLLTHVATITDLSIEGSEPAAGQREPSPAPLPPKCAFIPGRSRGRACPR